MTLSNDMLFYFNNNLFMRSNMFSTLQGSAYVKTRPYMGESTFDEPITDGELKLIRKYNKISNKYHKMEAINKRQLAALFDQQYRYPPAITSAFNDKHKIRAGLSLFYANNMEELLKLCQSRQKANDLLIKLDKRYIELESQWKLLK